MGQVSYHKRSTRAAFKRRVHQRIRVRWFLPTCPQTFSSAITPYEPGTLRYGSVLAERAGWEEQTSSCGYGMTSYFKTVPSATRFFEYRAIYGTEQHARRGSTEVNNAQARMHPLILWRNSDLSSRQKIKAKLSKSGSTHPMYS
jgi:hypothetical protein